MTMLAPSYEPSRDSAADTPEADPVRWALSRLRSPHWWDREAALTRLALKGAPAEIIVPSLRDRSAAVRLAAIAALRHAAVDNLDDVAQELLSAIDDPDARVVGAAIHALKVLRVERARTEIIAVLDDWCRAASARPGARHPFCIAKSAVGFLAALGPADVTEHFLPLLDLPWPEIRQCARWGITRLRYTPAAPVVIAALERRAMRATRSATDAEEARSYIRLLGALGAREAVPVLLRMARDAVGLRSTAVEALAKIDPERAGPQLVDMLDDPGSRLRRKLLPLMASSGQVEALPKIRTMLADADSRVRRAALRALARLRDRESVEAIRVLCHTDPNPYVRPAATWALAAVSGADAIPTLEVLATDTNAMVRRVAGAALERMRAEPKGPECSEDEGSETEGESPAGSPPRANRKEATHS
jgi:HEAT repeat protein